jgi:hypothetical protein
MPANGTAFHFQGDERKELAPFYIKTEKLVFLRLAVENH